MNDWLIVCTHLIKNPKLNWNDVGEDKLQGYLCDDCNAIGAANCRLNDLEPLSGDSVQALRGKRQ